MENKGWISVKNLKTDDLLKFADGTAKRVLEIKMDRLEIPVKVYNFEVEDWHTYFVSEFEILVHNNCGIPQFIKDNRVPKDSETIFANGTFKRTNRIGPGNAKIYEKNGNYYYRNTLHTGKGAHIEAFNKSGKHLGEVNPISGELLSVTANPKKRLNLK